MEEVLKKNIEELNKVYEAYELLNSELRKVGSETHYWKSLRIVDAIDVLKTLLEGGHVAEMWWDYFNDDFENFEKNRDER